MGGRGALGGAPNLPDPPKLALVPGTCRSSCVPGLSFRPLRSSSPPRSILHSPKLSPSRVPRTSPPSCPLPGLPALCSQVPRPRALHASRVSLQPNAAPRPPPLGCGSAWLESRQGKFPARGRPLVAAAAGGLLEPAGCPRHRGLCREWGSGISRLRVLRASGPQVVAGAFAASAARRAPCGPRGAPRVAGRLENLPGWRRLGERRAFPEDAERLAGAPRVAAPVRGALARSRKKRAVFAFANKREPELFPTGEAGRAATAFPPPRRSCPPHGVPVLLYRLPLPPGDRRDRAAPGGGERASARGDALGLCACKTPRSSELQDLGATSGGGCCELIPHLRSPQPGRMQRWASQPAVPGAPFCLGCVFCLHARGHIVM